MQQKQNVCVCVCGSHVLHAQSRQLTIHTYNGTIVVDAANARYSTLGNHVCVGTAGF
jgi:hypothetical protein